MRSRASDLSSHPRGRPDSVARPRARLQVIIQPYSVRSVLYRHCGAIRKRPLPAIEVTLVRTVVRPSQCELTWDGSCSRRLRRLEASIGQPIFANVTFSTARLDMTSRREERRMRPYLQVSIFSSASERAAHRAAASYNVSVRVRVGSWSWVVGSG